MMLTKSNYLNFFCLVLFLLITNYQVSCCQTVVTVDASGNLNVPNLSKTSSAGQTFFTGYQVEALILTQGLYFMHLRTIRMV